MPSITTAQKAPLQDQDGVQLPGGSPASSDDNLVCYVENQADGLLWVVGQTPGTATISATRNGTTATLEVTVTAAPFSIQLGAPVPK